ncbi:hypothetical protein Tco_0386379 [Tanacetum coccineum]
MEDPNITMKEYIRLEEEKARRHGKVYNWETAKYVIMESLVKKKQKGAILELKQRHLKNTIFCTYTPYPAMKIRRISASSANTPYAQLFISQRYAFNMIDAPNPNGTHTTPCPTNPNHAKTKTNGDTKIEINTELIMMWNRNFIQNDAPHSGNNNQGNEGICRVDKFEVIKYSIGDNEEFMGIRTLERDSWDQNVNKVSSIYLDIFRKKDEGWTVHRTKLAKARIARTSSDFSAGPLIMESLVKKMQKGVILELKRRHLKNTIFCTYTSYPAMKIWRISASSAQEMRNDQFPIRRIHYNQYAVCTAVHQSKIRI